jgi:hypothetical protein
VEYFHRRMEFDCVIGRMQDMGMPEGNLHPAPMDRGEAVRLWRAALVAQFLLPARRCAGGVSATTRGPANQTRTSDSLRPGDRPSQLAI